MPPTPSELETTESAEQRGLTRRRMIKGAAIAGAAAWTAPVIIDSLASPAAAVTGQCTEFTYVIHSTDDANGHCTATIAPCPSSAPTTTCPTYGGTAPTPTIVSCNVVNQAHTLTVSVSGTCRIVASGSDQGGTTNACPASPTLADIPSTVTAAQSVTLNGPHPFGFVSFAVNGC